MAKKKHKKREKYDDEDLPAGRQEAFLERELRLHPDAKKSVLAVLLIAFAIILVLARFEKAGPAGDFLFNLFSSLFGLGYYLIPLTLFLVSIVFFTTERQKVLAITAVGGTLMILSGLGFIDIISPKDGGIVGSAIGSIELPFGYIAALILTGAFFLASLIITINTPIKLTNLFARSAKDEDEEDEEGLTEKESKT